MKLSRRSRREWQIILWVSLVSAAVSAWFGIRVAPQGEPMLRSATHGVVTCVLVATPILLLQFRGERLALMQRLRSGPLVVYFLARVLIYFFVIVAGLLLSRIVLSHDVVHYVRADPVFRQALLFSVIMSVVGNLFFEFAQLLGMGTLKHLLTGRYARPRSEQKTFLLIDMKNSTGMAERLGPVRFHELLNAFFRDVADAALECDAEIHKYVGDEAILTWPGKSGLDEGAAIDCAFLVRDYIAANKTRYLQRFGAVPEFRAALHYGEIVAGEIGDIRREIAYVGDTLNVAARLLDATKASGRDVLVSQDLLDRTTLPQGFTVERLPTLTVRGRLVPLEVAALTRAT